ncbi:uncharacterized protein DS421_14g486160 [Arachis hypogaea]|nr:uncharacterized protein DS421_14g486160 [Arachis hypogaea]
MKPILFAIIFLILVSVMFLPPSTLAAPVVGKRGDKKEAYRRGGRRAPNSYIENNRYERGRVGGVHAPPNPVPFVPRRPYRRTTPNPHGRCNPYNRFCSPPPNN